MTNTIRNVLGIKKIHVKVALLLSMFSSMAANKFKKYGQSFHYVNSTTMYSRIKTQETYVKTLMNTLLYNVQHQSNLLYIQNETGAKEKDIYQTNTKTTNYEQSN